MASNRQIPELEGLAFAALAKQGLFSIDMSANTSPERQHVVVTFVENKITAAFLQAIIDDDRKTVTEFLNHRPELLLMNAANIKIESKLTWQKFKLGAGDTPLAIAAKRHQIEMINLLLPYYDKLAQDGRLNDESRQHAINAKEAGLKAWKFYETRRNVENENEIVIPTEYTNLITV